jgi:hypothetical protein
VPAVGGGTWGHDAVPGPADPRLDSRDGSG